MQTPTRSLLLLGTLFGLVLFGQETPRTDLKTPKKLQQETKPPNTRADTPPIPADQGDKLPERIKTLETSMDKLHDDLAQLYRSVWISGAIFAGIVILAAAMIGLALWRVRNLNLANLATGANVTAAQNAVTGNLDNVQNPVARQQNVLQAQNAILGRLDDAQNRVARTQDVTEAQNAITGLLNNVQNPMARAQDVVNAQNAITGRLDNVQNPVARAQDVTNALSAITGRLDNVQNPVARAQDVINAQNAITGRLDSVQNPVARAHDVQDAQAQIIQKLDQLQHSLEEILSRSKTHARE